MKINQITQYIADDGKIFSTEKECREYEKILYQVEEILNILPNREYYDKDLSFSNGGGYLKLNQGDYQKIESKLVEISNIYFKPENKFTKFNYTLGRYIDDTNMKCLNRLSYRLMCINNDKEYGQPYYANNPDQCENKQLN